jgi:HEAT repeat protein
MSRVALALLALILLVPSASAEETPGVPGALLDDALEIAGLRRGDLLIPADLVEPDPFRRAVVDRLMEHPLEAPGYVRALGRGLLRQRGALGRFQLALAQERIRLGGEGRALGMEGPFRYPAEPLEELLAKLIAAGREALGEDLDAMEALRDRTRFVERTLAIYGEGEEEAGGPEETLRMTASRRYLDEAAGVDRVVIARFSETVLAYATLLAQGLALVPPEMLARERTRTFEVDGLRIRIGGPGPDVHTGEIDVVIDVGGDDIYRDVRSRGPVAIVLDFGGNDLYESGGVGGPSSAVVGCSVLIDTAGDDVYRGGDHALACGVLGLGLLHDHAGDDVYVCGRVGQGAGVLGWGILTDVSGDDVYVGRKFVQGFAGVDGFGALIDKAGNDVYTAGGKDADPREKGVTQSLSQGFAYGLRPFASGGIALLVDAGGNDAYEGDYFAQGSSYWYALGALLDLDGNDRYAARRYSGGAGIHLSLGVLVDEKGNDAYSMGTGVGLGCGHDYAHGILLDAAGNDSYQAAWLCLGAGNANGVGILCDVSGNDAYSITRRSLGWGTWDKKRGADSIGLLLDGGGRDAYPEPGRDGRAWTQGRRGVGLDRERGADPFPAVDLATWLKALPEAGPRDAGFFTRGMAVAGPPPAEGTAAAKTRRALALLGRFEPGLEEEKREARVELRSLLASSPEAVAELVSHLDSPNIMVVIEADRALLQAGGVTAPELLEAALDHGNPRRAGAAIGVLGRMPGPQASAALRRAVPSALAGEHGRLRRAAASAARRIGAADPELRGRILGLLESSDLREAAAGVRAMAALPEPVRIELVTIMLAYPHHLVRAAARGVLADSGGPGREALIDVLRAGPAEAAVEAAVALGDISGNDVDQALILALERRDDRGVVRAALDAVLSRKGLAERLPDRVEAARVFVGAER